MCKNNEFIGRRGKKNEWKGLVILPAFLFEIKSRACYI
jgi:hypothetical protein